MALEDLTRYEPAGVAAMNVKKDSELAITAMNDFYRSVLKEEDPIITRALQEAASGGEAGIAHAGVIQAIGVYGGKYERAFASTKFSDLVNYLTESYDIPYESKEALGKYNEFTYLDLAKKLKDEKTSEEDKEAIQKAITVVEALKNRKLRATGLRIVNENIRNLLSILYSKEKKEEKKD